eukprot:CAMPEP_0204897234 /NCGR_PEP_ID=MMETSP1397-20131031/621_1 /ASSEMBLY_ACC=CAM_ASM_000891 /TAXON_ID=49980 /ORGANISM="Climacostomum Climacostomum virens, Strain Stock W-24" /LENGTH=372 /DNA_ID=CAMNT_0052064955 /DNA_START=400 /DNA_END=1515 /DNA_ORIENTATION=-
MASLFLLLVPASAQLLYSLTSTPSSTISSCNAFMCDSNPGSSQKIFETCLKYSNGTFLLNPCNYPDRVNNFCSYTDDPSSTPVNCQRVNTLYPQLYPGEEPCFSIYQCMSQMCELGKCIAGGVGVSCSSNSDCDVGFYCNSNSTVCTQLIFPGSTGCTQDSDCVTSAGCNKNSTDATGKCETYFSIPVGKPVKNCDSYVSMLCTTGQCFNATNSYEYTCVDAFESYATQPQKCSTQLDCNSKSVTKSGNLYSDCSCGYNSAKQAYCNPMLGDSVSLNYLKNLKDWISSVKIHTCHTDRRFNQLCQKDWEYEKYDALMVTQYAYSSYAKIQDNDECVKKIYTYEYWDFVADYDDDTDNASTSLLIGLALLLTS